MALDVISMLKAKIKSAEADKSWRPAIVLDLDEYRAVLAELEEDKPRRGRPRKVPHEAVREEG